MDVVLLGCAFGMLIIGLIVLVTLMREDSGMDAECRECGEPLVLVGGWWDHREGDRDHDPAPIWWEGNDTLKEERGEA